MKLQDLAEKYNYTCYYCRQKFPIGQLSRDHYHPRSHYPNIKKIRGGGEARVKGCGNHRIVLACKVCNLNKGDKIIDRLNVYGTKTKYYGQK